MRVAYADAAGIRTRFLEAGTGEALFLVHGIGASADSFVQNVRGLGSRLRVVAPDLVGHGFSAAGVLDAPAPHEQMARQLLALADALGIGRFFLAGTSYGALVCAQAALDAPQRVRRLVLVGSGSVFHAPEAQARTLRMARANGRKAMEEATFEACRQRLGVLVHDPRCIPDALVLAQLNQYALPDRIAEYEKTIEGTLRYFAGAPKTMGARLGELAMPLRVIVGRQDPRADWREHERVAAAVPGARVSVYDDCGHLPYLEQQARFDMELLEFFTKEDA
jgi:2-hydroxy-6-oxonona-2,4-dienedioate hydrolase